MGNSREYRRDNDAESHEQHNRRGKNVEDSDPVTDTAEEITLLAEGIARLAGRITVLGDRGARI